MKTHASKNFPRRPLPTLRDFAASLPDGAFVWLSSPFLDTNALHRAFRPRKIVIVRPPEAPEPYLTFDAWCALIARLKREAAPGTVVGFHHEFPVHNGHASAPGSASSYPDPYDAQLICDRDEFPTPEDGHVHSWMVLSARDHRVLGSLRRRRDEAIDETTGRTAPHTPKRTA